MQDKVLTPNAVLIYAALLIRQGWTQGSSAKNATGLPTYPYATDAVEFCAIGALIRAARDLGADVDTDTLASIWLVERLPTSISIWNDAVDQTAENVAYTLEQVAKENKYGPDC